MSGESLRPDLDAATWRTAWAEIAQALDSLRERLQRLEHAGDRASPGAAANAPDLPDLSVVQDILSIPSSTLHPGEGIVGRAFKERRVLTYTADAESDPPDPFIERFPVWAGIAVPVRAEDD